MKLGAPLGCTGAVPVNRPSPGAAEVQAIVIASRWTRGRHAEMDRRTGHCLCGDVAYAASGVLAPVVNCHCGFCRRVHGAPFVTVAFLPARALERLESSIEPAVFTTPAGNLRHFCPRCSTPVYNTQPGTDLACLIVSSLAPEFQPSPWFHVNTASKAPWYEIGDDLPRFGAWPAPKQVLEFARDRKVRIPDALVGTAG